MIEYLLPVAWAFVGMFIPSLAQKYAEYKYRKKNGSSLEMKLKIKQDALITAAAMLALSFLSIKTMDLWESVFAMIFCCFAFFGIYIDYLMRIISNVMLIAMLPFCIAYRVLSGGVSSLIGSLIALVLVVLLFAVSAGFTYLRKGVGGVGMGDVKLAMVIAIAAGYPGVLLFLFGMAVAIGLYCLIGLRTRFLSVKSYFPMCGQIMAGFMFSLFYEQIPFVLGYLF